MLQVAPLQDALLNAASQVYANSRIFDLADTKNKYGFNPSGDTILERDKIAHETFIDHLAKSEAVRFVLSEEANQPLKIGDGPYDISIDPLDGSKASIHGVAPGTIVAAYTHNGEEPLYDSANIIFSGLFIYSFFLNSFFADNAVTKRIFNPSNTSWSDPIVVPQLTSVKTLHINCSNSRHWSSELRDIVDQTFSLGFNTRWYGSLALSINQIVTESGGIFAYPADQRTGYENGYLRLIYEAAPLAFLIKKLGGTAHDGHMDILNKKARDLHERTPLFIGGSSESTRFHL